MADSVNTRLVSVIVPCYNAARFVTDALNSVLQQTYRQVEAIVVDDGSNDGTWQAIASFGDRVRSARLKRGGACRARNHGAAISSGDFLMFLDADDVIAPDTLESLVGAIADHTDCLAVCAWHRLRKRDGDWLKTSPRMLSEPPDGDAIRGWLSGWYIPPCAVLWPRELFDRVGTWDESLTANQDGDLMLRALVLGAALVQASGGKAYYRDHGGTRDSISRDVSGLALASRARVLDKVEAQLTDAGVLTRYRYDLGRAYYGVARLSFAFGEKTCDRELGQRCHAKAVELAGSSAVSGTPMHRFLSSVLGLERKERIARALRRAPRDDVHQSS